MRHLKLTVAYDGTDYVGWQVQPNGNSIQRELEAAWHQVTSESVRMIGSGRTDSKVHALAQVASLETASELGCDVLLRALNNYLPNDIAVLKVQSAPMGFHAVRDAIEKTYRYQIQFGPIVDVIGRHYRWHIRQRLDVEKMCVASQSLVGKHDFASFQAAGSERASTVRKISRIDVQHRSCAPYDYVDIEVSSDGFLYNMVRNIVGTLVQVGLGAHPPQWVPAVLEQRDRRNAGPTAPPHGLFLVSVDYLDQQAFQNGS